MEKSVQMNKSYYRLRLAGLTPLTEEIATYLTFEHGAEGSVEVLQWIQPELEYAPQTIETSVKTIEYFFDSPIEIELLSELQTQIPGIEIQTTKEQMKDWLSEWKKSFRPFLFVDPYWIVPSWIEDEKFQHSIYMEPGLAFGTGTHETTQLAGEMLAELNLKGKSVVDVGAGTGILSILSEKLGADRVAMLDNDEEAIRVSLENTQINHCTKIEQATTNWSDLPPGEFDLVVANIIEGVLLGLNEEMNKRLSPGGILVFSGLLLDQMDSFCDHYRLPESYVWDRPRSKGEWAGIRAWPAGFSLRVSSSENL